MENINNNYNIILGSGSKSRKRVLEKLGWTFKVMAADIDEKAIRFNDPRKLTLALAKEKANVLAGRINEPAVLITADQVVVCNGVIREKPENERQAREYLKSYGKYPAETINGVCVMSTITNKTISASNVSKIKFKPIPESIIDKLIEEGNIFLHAGGFSAEDPLLAPLIDYIDGTLDSVEGLPIELVKKLISEVSK